ncbi:hypothetical protein FQN57_004949 [Myotisia sp. PD_48]|nr:hypothetical protein FQN57_004949 [Myotisia sp. PD_48]
MEERVLAFHKSPKRKRQEAELPARTQSVDTAAGTHHFQQLPVPPFYCDYEDSSTGWKSPHRAVTGQLQDLDIHSPAISTDETTLGGEPTPDVDKDTEDAPPPTDITNDNHTTERSTSIDIRQAQERENDSDPKSPPSTNNPEAESLQPQTPPEQYSRPKSPPLTIDPIENPFTWHESEITGYDPTDPNDDGYGLDGIGFKPSATVAWNRSQRRKNQVAEWERREAREARARRKERRDGALQDHATMTGSPNQKRVKFNT